MKVLGRARTAPDGGSVLEWDVQEIFLVPAVYRKEAGRDLGGLCRGCGWQREGGNWKGTH